MNQTASTQLSPIHIDPKLIKLPNDIFHFYIFEYLDLYDIWSFRLVCKKCYAISRSYNRIYELTFDTISHNWFDTTTSPRPENQFEISKLSMLSRPSSSILNLKYLLIQSTEILKINLDDLNRFSKIEILKIGILSANSKGKLDLPNLKSLTIQFLDYLKPGFVIVNTPNLQNLDIFKTDELNLIDKKLKFKYPLSIKYLRINYYDTNMSSMFVNLECLEFCYANRPAADMMIDNLLKFNKLKILKFSNCAIQVVKLKDLFRSKGTNLQLVISGVRINEISTIDELDEPILNYQLRNFDRLENDLNFIQILRNNDLSLMLADNQPPNLFAKYNNIQNIIVNSRIQDNDRLIHLIRSSPNLCELDFYRSSLNQQFYDQLPVIKSLTNLKIYEEDVKLNFQFILNMPYLRRFFTNKDVLIGKKLSLNYFKRLRLFKFQIKDKKFYIEKIDRDRYRIINYKSLDLPDHTYISHNKLSRWSNWLRIKRRKLSRKRKLPNDFND